MEVPIAKRMTVKCTKCYTFFNTTYLEYQLMQNEVICSTCTDKINEDNKKYLAKIKKE